MKIRLKTFANIINFVRAPLSETKLQHSKPFVFNFLKGSHNQNKFHENENQNQSSSKQPQSGSTTLKRTALFLSIFFGAKVATQRTIQMIQDNQMRNLKKVMDAEVSKLRNQYGQMSAYPQIKYDMRGDTYTISFLIDQRKTDIFLLMTKFMSVYNTQKGFRVIDSKTFTSKEGIVTHYIDFQQQDPEFRTPQRGRITITGINTDERPSFRIIFQKDSTVTPNNIELIKNAYKESVKPREVLRQQMNKTSGNSGSSKNPKSHNQNSPSALSQLYKKMQEFGVTVFDPNDKTINLDWDYLAGYQSQKRSIEDTVLLALNYPEIYDQITQATRVKFEQNRPKAVLFEGPPGTGKTTSAKIIAQQVNIPLIYMPIEAIMSKYYGESEKKLADFWEACKKLGKVIIFIDEIDAIAGSRDGDMHEASRRVLSTLLRKIDSFESTTDVLLICATNRKKDLDAAMLSRIDLSINFSLPDKLSRAAIFKRYAKHLKDSQLQFLAESTQGFSGRNISDICKHAERKWASKLIRKQTEKRLPSLDQYISSLDQRKVSQLV